MTFTIKIIDSMSHLRVRLERHERQMMRGIINDVLRRDQMTIWCWEGEFGSGNNARREIFPQYKNRPPSPHGVMAQLGLLKELLSYTPAWQAEHKGFEGDDIVAALVENFRGEAPIEILSSDGDLTALCGPGVVCKAKCPVTPDLVPLYKITVGDSSDTIPGIRGFGKGDWATADKARLQSVLDAVRFNEPWTDEQAFNAGLRPPHRKWLRENRATLEAMRLCVAPLPMSRDQFNTCLHKGTDNPAAREALMARYFL